MSGEETQCGERRATRPGRVLVRLLFCAGALALLAAPAAPQSVTLCRNPGLRIPPIPSTGGAGSPPTVDQQTVAFSEIITDLNLSLNINHTFVGDVIVDLVHNDTGTNVRLLDRAGSPPGFGCGGNNIVATLDDEAALPVENQCAGGTPTISGSFIPNNPLSAFDGEDLSGTWTLIVTDAAAGDTGTLNQWCLVTPLSTLCRSPGPPIPPSGSGGSTVDTLAIAANPPVLVPGSITDVNVSLDVNHTFVGDLILDLRHNETGTSVRFVDRPGSPPGFGCGGNDVLATIDDEALLPVENQCAGSVPTINGTFTPNNPLSAFDGESLAGTWTLTASDLAGGDIGQLNQWCVIAEAVDLRVSKTESVNPVTAGSGAGNLTHVVTLANIGTTNASGVVLSENITLPAGVSIDSVTPSAGSYSGGPAGTWTVPNLPAGTSETLTIVYTVGACAANGGVVADIATVTASNESRVNTADDSASISTTVQRRVDLQVSKTQITADPIIAGSGAGNLVQQVTVTNAGPSCASGVTLSEVITVPSANTTLDSVVPSGTTTYGGGSAGTWTVGDLAAGGSETLTVTYTAGACETDGASVSDTSAVAAVNEVDTDNTNDSASFSTSVRRAAPLSVTKLAAPNPVVAGTALTYTIDVTNAGPSCAANVVVTDVLPAGAIASVDSVSAADFSCVTNGVTDVTCTTADLLPGVHSITIGVTLDSCPASPITNQATVTSDTPAAAGGPPQNVTTSQNTSISFQADLVIDKLDTFDPASPLFSDPVLVCNRLRYYIFVTNKGPSCAQNVTVTDVIPNVFQVIGTSPVSGGSFSCSIAGQTVTCDMGTVQPLPDPGTTFFVEVLETDFGAKGTVVSNTAAVSTPDPPTVELDATDNSVTQDTAIKPVDPYKMTLTAAPRFLRIGVVDHLVSLVKLHSLCDPSIATTNVNLTVTIPDQLAVASVSPFPTSQNGNALTYVFPSMSGLNTVQVVTSAALLPDVAPGATLTLSASATDDQGHAVTASFTGGVRGATSKPVSPAGDLFVTFTAVHKVLAGANLVSTISVDNTSRLPAQGTVLTVEGPDSLDHPLATPAPASVVTADGRTTITWQLGTIAGPGKSRVRLIQRVPSSAEVGTKLGFTASAVDDRGRNAGDTVTVQVRN